MVKDSVLHLTIMPTVSKKDDYNEYMRQYMAERYERRRKSIVEQLGGVCARCGSKDQLEIDHIDPPGKKLNISRRLAGVSEKALQRELTKCQLLCRRCHELKTILERGHTPAKGTHGTLSAYRWCGPPKCDECKRAKREYVRRRRSEDP